MYLLKVLGDDGLKENVGSLLFGNMKNRSAKRTFVAVVKRPNDTGFTEVMPTTGSNRLEQE